MMKVRAKWTRRHHGCPPLVCHHPPAILAEGDGHSGVHGADASSVDAAAQDGEEGEEVEQEEEDEYEAEGPEEVSRRSEDSSVGTRHSSVRSDEDD